MARVCVIRQGFYPLDTRVRREVHALAGAGHEVESSACAGPGQPRRERRGGTAVYRLPLPLQRSDGRVALPAAVRQLRARRRRALQPCCTRAAAGTSCRSTRCRTRWCSRPPSRACSERAWCSTCTSACPSSSRVKFGVGPRHPALRIVAAVEQLSIRFADRVITCTEQMRETFIARGAEPAKIAVVLNSADESIFDATRHPPARRRPDRFTILCHGAIEHSYGIDTLLRAAAVLRDDIPGLRVEIFGDGTYRSEVGRLCDELGLDGSVRVERRLGSDRRARGRDRRRRRRRRRHAPQRLP